MADSHQSSTSSQLGAALTSSLVSVEVLPGDGREWLLSESQDHGEAKEFLLIEGNLGVPQKVLYKAYLQAIPIFSRCRKQLAAVTSTPTQTADLHTLKWSSSVLILANSGHQAAWNARKRLVELEVLDVEQELTFTAALLTVRDCAKQSLLWHHRRWLLRRSCPSLPGYSKDARTHHICDEDTLSNLDISPAHFRGELDACTVAANTYERNYFAWSHRTRCLDALAAALEATNDSDPDPLVDLLANETANTSVWIERHVADYTAMQYRCRLASLLHTFQNTPSLRSLAPCYSHARSLVESYPEHEALWCYLRGSVWVKSTSLGDALVHSRKDELRGFGNEYIQEKEDVSRRNARTFLAWLDRM